MAGVNWTSLDKNNEYRKNIESLAVINNDKQVKIGRKIKVQPLTKQDIDKIDPVYYVSFKDSIVKTLLFFSVNPPNDKTPYAKDAYKAILDKLEKWAKAPAGSPEKKAYDDICAVLETYKNGTAVDSDKLFKDTKDGVVDEKKAAEEMLNKLKGFQPTVITEKKDEIDNTINADVKTNTGTGSVDDNMWNAVTKADVRKEAKAELEALLKAGVKNKEDIAKLIKLLKEMGWSDSFINIALSDKYLFKNGTITVSDFQNFCKNEIMVFDDNVKRSVAGYEHYDKNKKLFMYDNFVVVDSSDKEKLNKAEEVMKKDDGFMKSSYYKSGMNTVDMISAYIQYKGTMNCYKTNVVRVWKDTGETDGSFDTKVKVVDIDAFIKEVNEKKTEKKDSASGNEETKEDLAALDKKLFGEGNLSKDITVQDCIEWMNALASDVAAKKIGATDMSNYAQKMYIILKRMADGVDGDWMPAFTDTEKTDFMKAYNNALNSLPKDTTIGGNDLLITQLAKDEKFNKLLGGTRGMIINNKGELVSTVKGTDSAKEKKSAPKYDTPDAYIAANGGSEKWESLELADNITTKTKFYKNNKDKRLYCWDPDTRKMLISKSYKINADNKVEKKSSGNQVSDKKAYTYKKGEVLLATESNIWKVNPKSDQETGILFYYPIINNKTYKVSENGTVQ